MDFPQLPGRQREILAFIHAMRKHRKCAPTYQEISDELRISRATAFEHVEALIRKGCLIRHEGQRRKRNLMLTDHQAVFTLAATTATRQAAREIKEAHIASMREQTPKDPSEERAANRQAQAMLDRTGGRFTWDGDKLVSRRQEASNPQQGVSHATTQEKHSAPAHR